MSPFRFKIGELKIYLYLKSGLSDDLQLHRILESHNFPFDLFLKDYISFLIKIVNAST